MIPLNKPYFNSDDLKAVKQVMDSGWVSQGPKCEEFERAVADYLGCKYVISVSNCTAALSLSLMALGVGVGDEVIVPDYTFPATALAVESVGAKPVFVDVNVNTYNIDSFGIDNLITKRTKAIIPVHLFGKAAPMEGINRLASEYGLWVIEDAACALGTEYRGEKVGSIGDIGCFSLHAKKGITTGEGGLVATNDPELADRVRRQGNFGTVRTYKRKEAVCFTGYGFNYKMSDIAAAIGLVQLSRIDQLIKDRRRIAQEWFEIILNDPLLMETVFVPHIDPGHILQSFVCRTAKMRRQEVVDYIRVRGFEVGIGTYACHMQPHFYMARELSISKYLYENTISLPIWYGLNLQKEWERGGK